MTGNLNGNLNVAGQRWLRRGGALGLVALGRSAHAGPCSSPTAPAGPHAVRKELLGARARQLAGERATRTRPTAEPAWVGRSGLEGGWRQHGDRAVDANTVPLVSGTPAVAPSV